MFVAPDLSTVNHFWFFFMLMGAALVDSVNPCALSILFLTIAFLLNLGKDRRTILVIGASYIAGIFLTYLFIGLGLLQAMSFFGIPHFMAKAGAALLLAAGISGFLGLGLLKIPRKAHPLIATLMNRASIPAALGLGVLVGLTEFPCTGGPYLFALGMLHDAELAVAGFFYLVLYNMVFVAPLVAVLFFASSQKALSRLQYWRRARARTLRIASSIIMIGLAFLLFFLY